MSKKVSTRGFAAGFLVILVVAMIFPEAGAAGGTLHPEVTIQLAVMLMFLIQGLQLPTENLRAEILNWKLHLFIQTFGYVLMPAMVIFLDMIGVLMMSQQLRLGFIFLAVLPSTFATAIIFTGLSGGNMGGALFNTILSNVLAVILVPLLTALLITVGDVQNIPLVPQFLKIAMLVLAPLAVGQILRPHLKNFASKRKMLFLRLNAGLVYFIFYAVSCDSIKSGVWEQGGLSFALTVMGYSLLLLLLVKGVLWYGARLCRLNRANRIAAFFCGSQKSLAAGVPIAGSIFVAQAGNETGTVSIDLGIFLLPLICYHFLQLVVGGLLVEYIAQSEGE